MNHGSPAPAPHARRRGRALLAPAAATALLLAGCSTTVSVDAAPHATDPRCADVVLDLPSTVAGLAEVGTTSQATAAWGDAGAAVTLRCGVTVPGPTTIACQAITGGDGLETDWIGEHVGGQWVFVTFGRDPAVEVRVPDSVHLDQPTAALVDVGPAVHRVPSTARCR